MGTNSTLFLGLFFSLTWIGIDASAQARKTPEGPVLRYINSGAPSWLRIGGEERFRTEGVNGLGFKPNSDTYLLQRLRLHMDVRPLSWLGFSVEAQDSRMLFTRVSPSASQKNPMDLRLGYVQVGSAETSPVILRAGRQDLAFGEGRLVADPGWSNVGRTFDGLLLTARIGKVRIDTFSGISDRISIDGFDLPTPGEHFHGIYGSIGRLVPEATLDFYELWRLENVAAGETTKAGKLDSKTTGLRLSGKLPARFDYGLEMALQRGRQAGEPISAWAGHWVVGHTLPHVRTRPRFFAEWNCASGDENPHDGHHGTFDPLFPSRHDKFGISDQFGWTNIMHARPGFQFWVRESLRVSTAYNSFWLANRHDALYGGTKPIVLSDGSQGRHVGHEADFQAQWNASRHTVIDVGFGHVFPGEFLRNTGRITPFNCWFLGVTQRF